MITTIQHQKTVGKSITERTRQYAAIPLFQAFATDRIPVERFPDFFREQYMTARWFQDLIWATTEIDDGPFADFACEHRRVDSGHYAWMKRDLEAFGLPPMTDDDWFAFEWLPTRIQMSRILARCHDASPSERMIILACLESAGEVTLGTLFGYARRHGLSKKVQYLGEPHVKIEERQVSQLREIADSEMHSNDAGYLEIVDLVFDALTTMFERGGYRYYTDFLNEDAGLEGVAR